MLATRPAPQPRLMLHVCCAPDTTVVVERCKDRFDLALFFYDPNIHPYAEYRRRADEAREAARAWGAVYYEGTYDAGRFFENVRGLESELEKGLRCDVCFDMRLEATARLARQEGYPLIGTVLTTSPKKDAEIINGLGREAAARHGVTFLGEDWKKDGGHNRSIEIAARMGMFRQDYCGCVFSQIEQAIEAKLQARRAASRSGLESGGPPVWLYGRVRDAGDRWMLVRRESAWHLPHIGSASGHKSRDRLRNHLRQEYGLRVRLEVDPHWMEECFLEGPDKRHVHVLFWEARLNAPIDGTPHPQVRWIAPPEIESFRLGATTAALLARR